MFCKSQIYGTLHIILSFTQIHLQLFYTDIENANEVFTPHPPSPDKLSAMLQTEISKAFSIFMNGNFVFWLEIRSNISNLFLYWLSKSFVIHRLKKNDPWGPFLLTLKFDTGTDR